MDLGMVISVYRTVFKALGLSLRHPDSTANANAPYQFTATEHLAKSVVWMSAPDECAEQSFNITNGDVFRWIYIWPVIADYFEMDRAQPQRLDMKQTMADKVGLLTELVVGHGLRKAPYAELISGGYGNFIFTPYYDSISSMTKAR